MSTAQLDGDVSDLIAMFAETFPDWTVAHTQAGWWAARGALADESGRGTVHASTPAELYVRMQDAT